MRPAGSWSSRRSGKIINVASLFSFLGGQQLAGLRRHQGRASSASPRPTATSSAEHNIQVNAIAPGYFTTAITEAHPGRSRDRPPHRRAHPGRPLGGSRRPDGGAWSSWPAGPRTTSTATSWWSTAATSSADHHSYPESDRDHGPIPIPADPSPIVDAMTGLLGPAAVDTRDEQLQRGQRRPVPEVHRGARHLRRAGPGRDRLPGLTAEVAAVLDVRRAAPRQRRAADRRHRHRGRPGDGGRGLPRGRRLAGWTRSWRSTRGHDGHRAVRRPLQTLEDTRPRRRASPPGTRRSPSRSPSWAGWSPPARSASSPRCTAASRTWSSVWRRCSPAGTSPGSRTCRAARRAPTSDTSSSATRARCASSPR